MTTPEQPGPPTVTEMNVAKLDRRLDAIAEQLNRMAAEVRQHRARLTKVPAPGLTDYAGIAAEVQHVVLWGLANLAVDGLTRPAAEADASRARGE